MKKRGLVVVLVFILAIVAGNVNSEEGGKIDAEVLEKVEDGEVKVFINLEDEKKKLFADDIEEVKKDVIDIVGEEDIRFEFDDSISAVVEEDELDDLERIGGVESIEMVGVREVFLQDSVVQINASVTWPLQFEGINLTGEGQTICIIDSGINYSHNDLGGCWGNSSLTSGCKVWGGWDYCADDASCTTEDSDPMDVLGHGTHVSGIAAANGTTLKGVAPGARIIIQKVCNSTGSCFDDAIQSGMNWCINNASIFNISVISMSLGGGAFSDYCNSDSLADEIDDAVGSGISVVVATGNAGSTTKIAAPACVQNATAVGSIRKDDSTFDYNRNALVQLIAPGVNINSTYPTSLSSTGYAILSGTSMATPHVSGAIAILSQYLNLTGQVKSAKEKENTLNNTGKRITDSGSGVTFSRVNIYDAVISLDSDKPNVSLISPTNGTRSGNVNQSFRCNSTDLSLSNVTFYLWNSSGDVVNSSEESVSGGQHSFEINISNMAVGSYDWNCLYVDANSNSVFAESNYSLTVSEIIVDLFSPPSGLFTNENQTFSCNATANNELNNVTFYLWNSSSLESTKSDNISGSANSSVFSYNFSLEDTYEWNCLYVDNSSSENFASSNYTLTYDLSKPSLNVSSPLNGSFGNIGRFNVSLNENGTCIYSLDRGANNVSMSSTNEQNYNATNGSLSQGDSQNVTFYCNDSAGNFDFVDANFNIDLTKPNVSLINPVGGHSVTGTTEIRFEYNVSDSLNISSCDLVLDSVSVASNLSGVNSVQNNISYEVSAGNYNWQINCTDQAGNVGNSSSRSLTVNSASSGGGSSGGGGGGGSASISSAKTYSITREQGSNGYSNDLKKNDKIEFEIFDEEGGEHSLTVDYVGENFVNLTIKSTPIIVVLGIGQSIKLNLTSLEFYDLFVRLDHIVNGEAKLTIQTIREPIVRIIDRESEDEVTLTPEIVEREVDRFLYVGYVFGGFIFLGLIVLIFFVWSLRERNKMKKEIVKEVKKELKKEN
jgi:subtilisin family serine protease